MRFTTCTLASSTIKIALRLRLGFLQIRTKSGICESQGRAKGQSKGQAKGQGKGRHNRQYTKEMFCGQHKIGM